MNLLKLVKEADQEISTWQKAKVKALERIAENRTVLVLEKGNMHEADVTIVYVGLQGDSVLIRREDNGKEYWASTYFLREKARP